MPFLLGTPHKRERKQSLPQRYRTLALKDHFCRRQNHRFRDKYAAFVKTFYASTQSSLLTTSLFPSPSEVCTYRMLRLHPPLQTLTPQRLLLPLVLWLTSLICFRSIFRLHFPTRLPLMARHPPSLIRFRRTCNHTQPGLFRSMKREHLLIDLSMEYFCSTQTSSF